LDADPAGIRENGEEMLAGIVVMAQRLLLPSQHEIV
jgi:hypothetical protein